MLLARHVPFGKAQAGVFGAKPGGMPRPFGGAFWKAPWGAFGVV